MASGILLVPVACFAGSLAEVSARVLYRTGVLHRTGIWRGAALSRRSSKTTAPASLRYSEADGSFDKAEPVYTEIKMTGQHISAEQKTHVIGFYLEANDTYEQKFTLQFTLQFAV